MATFKFISNKAVTLDETQKAKTFSLGRFELGAGTYKIEQIAPMQYQAGDKQTVVMGVKLEGVSDPILLTHFGRSKKTNNGLVRPEGTFAQFVQGLAGKPLSEVADACKDTNNKSLIVVLKKDQDGNAIFDIYNNYIYDYDIE